MLLLYVTLENEKKEILLMIFECNYKESLVASRVILVVAFVFLPQNFGTWQGPANGTLYSMNRAEW